VHYCGAPGVAVVEADHPEAAIGKQPAEVVLPLNHLISEADHEQKRRRGLRPEGLVAELDLADVREALSGGDGGHQVASTPPSTGNVTPVT
jgi:hypothetical protein